MFNKLFIFLFLIVSFILFLNYYANPPDGYTGAPVPDELSCRLCHFYDTKHIEGSTEIAGIPEKIIPGKTYPVEIIVDNPDKKAVRTSFQFTALHGESSTGTLLNPKGNVKFTSYKNRNYAESQPGVKITDRKTFFYFDWKAPDEPDNSIISFYATSVLADGDNTFANDAVKETAAFGVLGNSLDVSIIDYQNNFCRGDSSGFAKIKVSGGTPPYQLKWSNGTNKDEISNLKAGLYFVTATDAGGIKGIGKIKITEPDILLIDSIAISHVSATESGKIEVFLSGGTLPYTCNWECNDTFFSHEQNIYNLSPGKYIFMMNDSCGAVVDTVLYIENKTASSDNIIDKNVILYPVPAKTSLNLYSQYHKIKYYSIFDLSNKIIKKGRLNDYKCNIDVSSLKTGIYFIELSIANQKTIKKIIIY